MNAKEPLEPSEPPVPAEMVFPQDLAACHQLLTQLAAAVEQLHREKLAQQREIEYLIQLAFRRRSERYLESPDQLQLDLGESDAARGAVDSLQDAKADLEQAQEQERKAGQHADEQTVTYTRTKPSRRPREERLPEHLPRYEVVAEATDAQRHCAEHGERKVIGYDRTETLEFTRPQLKVRVTLYPKFACEGAPQCGVQSPERAPGLVEGSRYDTSVAAQIIADKYDYHLPIYRQQNCFAGSGWTPSRSTLLNLLSAAAALLAPLARCFADEVRKDAVIGTDDTGVTLLLPQGPLSIDPRHPRRERIVEVLSEAQQRGERSVTAKMWAYRGASVPLNVFDFTVSHHRDGPDEFLVHSGYAGVLMADCYSGYQKIALRSDGLVRRAACNAHARRKVLEAHGNHPLAASVLLAMYQELYDLEDRGKALSDVERQALRQSEAAPVWERMRAYLDSEAIQKVLPKEAMGQAIGYLNNHWDALRLYLTDGRIPIDNNLTEQLMKQVALGRKNWLFIGSVAAGERAADLMTVVSSAHRNDLDVWAYLKGVLDELLAGSTDYERLRPDVWAASHPEQLRVYRQEERRDRADRKSIRRDLRRRGKGGGRS